MAFTARKSFVAAGALFLVCSSFSAARAVPDASVTATTIPHVPAAESQDHHRSSPEPAQLPHFKGVGNAHGKVETGFVREEKSREFLEDKDRQSGIKFSPEIQKFVERAGKTITDIDEATLNAVQAPLGLLGIEAESARIRPSHGGVGLGISIKLDKKKEHAENKNGAAPARHGENELYELLAPQNDGPHSPSGF
ncbi:hypothetical protein [Pyramidobacter piscolens]|uniref:hypothetical protein n=1 Tax=Pyramidobacter piscolens TaxID=638849 RepID=UPI00266527CE|nr:hypothetical protein [Pyramidobacter piscolens]